MAGALQTIGTPAAGAEALSSEVLFGVTQEMQRIRRTTERIALVRIPVLICGESGTGKEALAKYIHRISTWNEKPLVKVICAAIPGTLLESELFGYEKGSFTGAYVSRMGKFELAGDGTVILDEIAAIGPGLQEKLLQVLQDGQFCRIGDLEERRADARIICITSRDLATERERGAFREDLYYRINVVNLSLPPLRQRLDDLPTLVDHFMKLYTQQFGNHVAPLPTAVMDRFREHRWPGNIRELENYMKRYVILNSPEKILSELDERRREPVVTGLEFVPPEDFSLKRYSKKATQQAEKYLILEALIIHFVAMPNY